MANQGVSNERKKELEQLDPFQENLIQAMSFVKKHNKQLLLILGAVVVVILVFSGIMSSFERAENKASELMAKAVDQYNKAADDPVKAYEAVRTDFQTILDEYTNTGAGKMARVKFARICFDAKQYDQAHTLYESAYDLFKNETGMKNFLLSSLGHVSLARKDMEAARKYFQQLESGASDLMKDDALFALAGLYGAENKTGASREMYEKIVNNHETSIYKAVAENSLASAKEN